MHIFNFEIITFILLNLLYYYDKKEHLKTRVYLSEIIL